jgi:hypothetical protein
MKHLNDYHAKYEDGSLGGWAPLNIPSEKRREQSGYGEGQLQASSIIASLQKNGKGKIIETIKVITHSMGAAYAKGYVQAILEYAHALGITIPLIAFEADFAPYEPDKQTAVKDPLMGPTKQYSHNKDWVAHSKPEQGAEQEDTSKDQNQTHWISDFMQQIQTLPAGTYKVVDGKIVPQ